MAVWALVFGATAYVRELGFDPAAVVRMLRAAVGDDGFHYAVAFPEQPGRRLFQARR